MKKSSKKEENKSVQTPVPEIALNAPLTVDATTQPNHIDEVMVHATRSWLGGLSLFVVFSFTTLLIAFGYVKNTTQSSRIVPSLSPAISHPSISPSPFPKDTMRIMVWNGSGIAGEAGRVKNALVAAGYGSVEVSNAPKVQTGSTIKLSSVVSNSEQEMKDILSKMNKEVAQVEELLEGNYEVLLIIGK